MSKQKVIFLYTSPSGETLLNTLLQEYSNSLTKHDSTKVWESFMRAIYKCPEGHAIRVWFNVEYSDASPEIAFLKHFLTEAPEGDIFFARIGEEPEDVEEIGSYARIKLPGTE